MFSTWSSTLATCSHELLVMVGGVQVTSAVPHWERRHGPVLLRTPCLFETGFMTEVLKSSACHLLCWLCIEGCNTSAEGWTWERLSQGKYFTNWLPSAVRQCCAWLQTPEQTHPFSCTSRSPRAQFCHLFVWGKVKAYFFKCRQYYNE